MIGKLNKKLKTHQKKNTPEAYRRGRRRRVAAPLPRITAATFHTPAIFFVFCFLFFVNDMPLSHCRV